MQRTNFIFILGFLFLLAGIFFLISTPYYVFKTKTIGLIFLAIGTFLIIAEVVTYHKSFEE